MSINVPTTDTGKRMLKSISPIYSKSYTARWIIEVMGIEIEEAREYIEELRLQAYPETATWGLRYWEQRYHIRTDENLSIEERRQVVKAKRWRYAPVNPRRLEILVSQATGRTAHIVEYNSEYRFEIVIDSDGAVPEYEKCIELLKAMKPSHLAVGVNIHRAYRQRLVIGYTGATGAAFETQPVMPEYVSERRANSAGGIYCHTHTQSRLIG